MPSGPFLLVVRIDVAPEAEDAFNEWYTSVHLPEIVNVPGFREGKRYRLLNDETFPPSSDEQRYIAVYEFDGPEVLMSQAFQEARGWRADIAPFLRNKRLAVYEEIASYSRSS